jgi:hypothetical protein
MLHDYCCYRYPLPMSWTWIQSCLSNDEASSQHLPWSTISFEHVQGKSPTLSYFKLFGSTWYIYIPDEDHSLESKHLIHPHDVIIVGYSRSPKIYWLVYFEDEYAFTTQNLTFPKKTSPQVATTLWRISQDLELDPGSTTQDWWLKDHYTTISGHTRVLAEDIVSDQDWN